MWQVRNSDGSSAAVMEFPAAQLRDMLHAGLVGEQQEFLPPGRPDDGPWLSAFQALRLLDSESRHDESPGTSKSESADPARSHADRRRKTARRRQTREKPGESRRHRKPSVGGQGMPPVKATDRPSRSAMAETLVRPPHEFSSALASGSGGTLLQRKDRRVQGDDDDEDELEITPMIDMTFLLLIFFMVTSSVTAMATLELPKSQTGRSEKTEDRVVLVADFAVPPSGNELKPLTGAKFITLADARLFFQNEPDRVFPATDIDTELKRAFQEKPGSRFVLQANRKMPVGLVRQLIKSASTAGAAETLVGVTMPR